MYGDVHVMCYFGCFPFGFEGGTLVLIAPVPDHCLPFTPYNVCYLGSEELYTPCFDVLMKSELINFLCNLHGVTSASFNLLLWLGTNLLLFPLLI